MPASFRSLSAMIFCCVGLLGSCATTPKELACTSPLDAKVGNSCVVSEQTLWRGARPDPQAAAALVELGVKTIVSLELLLDDRNAWRIQPVDATH